jgi:hypothetical protein
VTQLNLADLYRSANITLSAENFTQRQTAFSGLGKSLSVRQVVDLVRIYFGTEVADTDAEWFREGFASTDSPFSLIDNRREASLLAGSLLLTSLVGGNAFAGVTVLAASVRGKRIPAVNAIDTETFETSLKNLATRKQRPRQYATNLKPIAKTTVTKEKLAAAVSIPALADDIFLVNEESYTATKSSFAEVQSLLSELGADLAEAREEIEMLWWIIAGWSRSLNRSFVEIGVPLSAVSAGFDLADLSLTVHGPYAADAMFTRVLSTGKKQKETSATIALIGDSVNADLVNLLNISPKAQQHADICPLTNALMKGSEVGKGSAWHLSFQHTSGVDTAIKLTVAEIAMQAMYERLVLSIL